MAETELAILNPAVVMKARETAIHASPAKQCAMRIEEHALWHTLSDLTMAMTAGIAVKGFKVKDLLGLEPGQVIESTFAETEDVPLKVGQLQVAWSEFEVVDQHLMMRLTRLI
jgi:flagellar motor switch protein FliM